MISRAAPPLPALRTAPRSMAGSPRNGVASLAAAAGADNNVTVPRLLKQHRVLMEAGGFTHDQASLILQVATQRTSPATGGASPTPVAEPAAAAARCVASPEAQPAAATASGSPAAAAAGPATTAASSMLEERVTFLEMELLKQALTTTPQQQQLLQAAPAAAAARSAGGTTGAGYLDAAAVAAAAAQQQLWNADASLLRQRAPQQAAASPLSLLGAFPGLPDATTAGLFTTAAPGQAAAGGDPAVQAAAAAAAAAAALAQLDPEVRAIAEVLSVRQGFGSLQDAAAATAAATAAAAAQAQAQAEAQQAAMMSGGKRRPASIYGRPGTAWQSMPLSARTAIVNGSDYRQVPMAVGEPLLAPGDLEDDVPYQPSSWAVVGTIACVYLGVVATFLLMCVGDVVGSVPY